MSLILKVRWTAEKSYRQFPFESSLSAKGVIEAVCRKNKISNPQDYSLYVPPNAAANGYWMEQTSTLGSANLKSGDLVELKYHPHPLFLCLAENNPKWISEFGFKEDKALAKLKVDYSDPLIELMPLVDRLLTEKLKWKDKDKEEFTFQHIYNNGTNQVAPLNSNISLEEQDILKGSWIAITLISYQNKRSVDALKDCRMKGFLTKVSVKEKKTTASKKRWCVLKDNFLYYFKSQEEKTPNGVVAVEFYALTVEKADNSFSLTPAPGNPFSRLTTTYAFSTDSESEYKEWVTSLRDRSFTGAGKIVFGIPLAKVLRRKDRPTMIPAIMEKTVKYIEEYGLEQEGIFRISGGAAVIEKFKDEFNQSLDVDLNRCGDPHVAAGLLKLYLRELPEPLLTFDLYDRFIAAYSAPKRNEVLKTLVEQLPTINRTVLGFLLTFLRKVSQKSKTNLMTTANLATVFAPNILRPKLETAESMVQQAAATNSLMEVLLQEQDYLFSAFKQALDSSSSPSPGPAAYAAAPKAVPPGASKNPLGAIASSAALAVSALKRPPPASKPSKRTASFNSPDIPVEADRNEYAIALYDYTASSKEEIGFTKGAAMKVIQKQENGWLYVELNGQNGSVPATYVKLSPIPSLPVPESPLAGPKPPERVDRQDSVPTLDLQAATAPAPTSGNWKSNSVRVSSTPVAASTAPASSPRGALSLRTGSNSGSGGPSSPAFGGPIRKLGSTSGSSMPHLPIASLSTGNSLAPTSAPPPIPLNSSLSPSPPPPPPEDQPSVSRSSSPGMDAGEVDGKIRELTERLQEEVQARKVLEDQITILLQKLEEETKARIVLEQRLREMGK